MIIRFPQNIWLHNKYNTLRLFDSSYFPVIFNTEVRKSNNTVFKNYYLKYIEVKSYLEIYWVSKRKAT